MADLPKDHPQDGRKYHVGDRVDFTDDNGKVVPGVVHAVRYQQGRYEWVGAQRPDMHSPEGPGNEPIPGTGHMELVKGTENERHSFEYIMVHEHEHDAWWDVENKNQAKIKIHQENVKKHEAKTKGLSDADKVKVPLAPHPPLESHPDLKQHLRVYESD